MNNQTLFIYELPTLLNIFLEIEENLNFEVKNIKKKEISEIDFNEHKTIYFCEPHYTYSFFQPLDSPWTLKNGSFVFDDRGSFS